MSLLGKKQRIICCVVAAPFSNDGHKISSNMQNEWLMDMKNLYIFNDTDPRILKGNGFQLGFC